MGRTIVCKFGGTSLADAGQFRKIKNILNEDPARRIVVASAPGKRSADDIKVTDLLIECCDKAAHGEDYSAVFELIGRRFRDIADELGVDTDLASELETIRNHLDNGPDKAYMLSRGEYLNSRLLADYLGFTFVDPAWCVCFDHEGNFDSSMTQRAMGAALKPLDHAVVAGFYGADSNGRIFTFSRGGSDITGSIAARAIGADLYENWTDVSGLLAADPRIVDNPKSVDYLSYRELRTLSYMGASVLHSDAVRPAAREGIPINIRNTNRPQDPGTMIVGELPEGRRSAVITGVAGRRGMSVIQVEKVMASDGAGFSARMLDILKNREIPFEQCLTGIDTVSLVIRSDLLDPIRDELIDEIRTLLKPDTLSVKDNLSMIAVVGEAESGYRNATVRILKAVTDAGIEISTINQGAGCLNLIIGVAEDRYKDAIRAIYNELG